MNLAHIVLILSGLAGGLSLSLFPNPYIRNGSHVPIWSFGLSLAAYLLFLAVCANYSNFVSYLMLSLLAGAGGFATGFLASSKHSLTEKPSLAARSK